MKFSKTLKMTLFTTLVSLLSSTATLAELMIFPAKGQNDKQIEQDKYSCYGWAKKQTGFDPMAVPQASTAAPSQQQRRGGLVRGGLAGAAIGGIADGSHGARKGAAIGAVVGGIRQRSSNNARQQQNDQWEQQQATKYANSRATYDRAYSACLEGKGYTVK